MITFNSVSGVSLVNNDYEQLPDGSWKKKPLKEHPSSVNPILNGDGWMENSKENQQSSDNPTPGKLVFITARDAVKEDATTLEPFWGNFLYPQSIHILNSVSGAGKTTLCYNLSVFGCRGDSFANLPFKKPLKIVYADLETSKALRAQKLRLVAEDSTPDNLFFIPSLNIIDNFVELSGFIKDNRVDMLIVDTLNEAFNTKDEQDNAEANRQFTYLKQFRDETGCSILLIAHIGKGEQTKKVYATRGASARAASVDVVLNLTESTEDEICLSKEKDRIGGGKDKLYLRKAGEDTFEVVNHSEDQETPQLIRCQPFILDAVKQGDKTTAELATICAGQGFSRSTVERALSNLYHAGKVSRLRKGVYSKIPESSKVGNLSGDDLKDDGITHTSKIPSVTNMLIDDGLTDGHNGDLTEEEKQFLLKEWERRGSHNLNLGKGGWAELGLLLYSTDNYMIEKRRELIPELKKLLLQWKGS